jgi:predicted TPR repeat methyltransferase
MILDALDLSRARRILDWGCGTGTFLSLVPEAVDKFGVEPARRAAQAAERAGIRVLSLNSLQSAEWNHTFDVVTLIDVIEHLSDLDFVLLTASRLLRPGGKLVFLTGDFDSRSAKKAGRYWYYLHYAEHLTFFSEPSVRKWLEGHFEQIAFTTVTHHPLSIAARTTLWARYGAAICLEKLGLAERCRVSAKRFVTSDHMLVTAVRRVASAT